MVRGPRQSRDLPEGWEYTRDALDAWDEEIGKFDDALYDAWVGKTRIRGSRSLDAPDCHEAGRHLLVGLPAARWKTIMRVATSLLYIVAGVLIREAFVTGRNQTEFYLFLAGGVIVAVLTATLQETVLKK